MFFELILTTSDIKLAHFVFGETSRQGCQNISFFNDLWTFREKFSTFSWNISVGFSKLQSPCPEEQTIGLKNVFRNYTDNFGH